MNRFLYLLLNMAIEIVSCPMKHGDVPSIVCCKGLPEGTLGPQVEAIEFFDAQCEVLMQHMLWRPFDHRILIYSKHFAQSIGKIAVKNLGIPYFQTTPVGGIGFCIQHWKGDCTLTSTDAIILGFAPGPFGVPAGTSAQWEQELELLSGASRTDVTVARTKQNGAW